MENVKGEVFQGNNEEEKSNIKDDKLTFSTQEHLSITSKSKFMEDFEQGITIEESRKKVYAKIDGLWSK